MANRHLSRSVVLQTLFEWDFNHFTDSKIQEILERNLKEFAPGLEEKDFARRLTAGVIKHRKTIDKIIEKAAPEWPIDKIAIVDRNVLRIGLFELIYGDKKEVPSKVAINEAIELAKTFSGEVSGKFVNGVMGTVYRELEENQESGPIEEKLAGAVVYRYKEDKIYLALVHDVFGYWTLSKGKVKEEEILMEAAKREIKEEIGIDIEIEDELGINEYIASDPERGKVKKIVTYFLGKAKNYEIKLKETGGLDDARWFEINDLANLKIYDDIRPIIAKAIKIIIKKK